MKRVNRFLMVMLVILVTGCLASQQENATKAMLVTQIAIIDVAKAADQLCTAGTLTQGQCDEIRTAYEYAKVNYNLAETALSTAIRTDSEEAWTNYNVLHENFQRIYADLLAVALKYGITVEVTE
jgi:hypothetical protein